MTARGETIVARSATSKKRCFYSEARSALFLPLKPTASYGNAPTVIDTCSLCFGVNLSTAHLQQHLRSLPFDWLHWVIHVFADVEDSCFSSYTPCLLNLLLKIGTGEFNHYRNLTKIFGIKLCLPINPVKAISFSPS